MGYMCALLQRFSTVDSATNSRGWWRVDNARRSDGVPQQSDVPVARVTHVDRLYSTAQYSAVPCNISAT